MGAGGVRGGLAGAGSGLTVGLGSGSIFTQEAWLFSTSAVITFGGAYAALGYVAQQTGVGTGGLRPAT